MKRALATTPVAVGSGSPSQIVPKAKKPRRRVRFAENCEAVKVFDERDPIGEDFHLVFADVTDDTQQQKDEHETVTEEMIQTLSVSPNKQTTPQKFSLHEFVVLFSAFFLSLLDDVD